MPIPTELKKLNKSLMRQEVHSALREWIIDGTLGPEEQLRDAELAEALGVSRMPIREAFLRLESEGLIETSANRWTRVSPVDVGQARRIYPILWTLEPLALSLAEPRLKKPELRLMVEANKRLTKALDSKQPIEASEADREFHKVFIDQSNNEDLVQILDVLKFKLRRLEIAYFGGSVVAMQSTAEHSEIIEALENGDVRHAARAVERNWQKSFERILARFRRDPE